MKFFYTDKEGRPCAAKAVFMMFSFIFMIKILLSNMTFGVLSFGAADYPGMAAFLSPLMAAYLGRAYTKSKTNA